MYKNYYISDTSKKKLFVDRELFDGLVTNEKSDKNHLYRSFKQWRLAFIICV